MPSHYAHYRFGAAALTAMEQPEKQRLQRQRRFYDIGLHGPDIFFFGDPLYMTGLADLGHKLHMQSGREFFTRICRRLRLSPSDQGLAYVYGLLSHYCLDALAHPYVKEAEQAGEAAHIEMETEFDRFLLERDGKLLPSPQAVTGLLPLSRQDAQILAPLYPSVTAAQLRSSVARMGALTRLLTGNEGLRHSLLRKGLSRIGNAQHFLLTPNPNPRCQHTNQELLLRYRRAQELFPKLLSQLQAHMTCGTPLGAEFDPIFG